MVYMVAGVKEQKTVFLTDIMGRFRALEDWIVIQ